MSASRPKADIQVDGRHLVPSKIAELQQRCLGRHQAIGKSNTLRGLEPVDPDSPPTGRRATKL